MARTAFVTVDTDQIITDQPVLLFSVALAATSGGIADATLYAGRDATSGRKIVKAQAPQSTTKQRRFSGVFLEEGLFVDVGSNVDSLMVEIAFPGE